MKSLENQDTMIQELVESRGNDRGLKKRLDRQEGFVQQIVEILSSITTSAVPVNGYNRLQTSLEMDLMDAMNSHLQELGDEDSKRLKISPRRQARIRKGFMSTLWYDGMFDRETGVVEAHQTTLKWIFEQPSGEAHTSHNFSQWLESDNQLYWITGKMGSGKSTLMKYISQKLHTTTSKADNERRCTPFLLRWAKDKPLLIATFYFWAGSSEETKMQTSTEGLYRTLLSQILEAYPEAAPHVSPRRWENLCLFNKVLKRPGITELKGMLNKAVEYVSSIASVCFFIDGLDELQGGKEDIKGLIYWVKTLTETFPVKMCVASRPWRVFEDALQNRPHLLMEDFNSKDIHEYVSMRFHEDPNFVSRKKINRALCDEILDEIVVKAEGVFLWVNIVCTSLLEAMSKGDLMGRLKRVLKELPIEMEKLYDHILDNLEPSYKDHAAQYFFLMEAYRRTPDALIFSFADDIGEDSEFPINMPRNSLTDAELQYRGIELGKRINSRCRGLLCLAVEELESGKATTHLDIGTVQYCHRSVKDYLTRDNVHGKLTGMLKLPFDPHLRLCSAYLARWKCSAIPSLKGESQRIIYHCVLHAAEVASGSFAMMIRLLDELNTDLRGQLDFVDEDFPMEGRFLSGINGDHSHFGPDPWFGGTLLSLTVVVGVIEFVRHKVGRDQGCVVKSSCVSVTPTDDQFRLHLDPTGRLGRSLMEQEQEIVGMLNHVHHDANCAEQVDWPLLLDALLAADRPDPAIISLLLDNNADPNLIIRRAAWARSAWGVVSYRLREDTLFEPITSKSGASPGKSGSPGKRKAWMEIVCLLLRHGFKPDRSDVEFLRSFLGEDVIKVQRLPHLGRHREMISKLLARITQIQARRWKIRALRKTTHGAGQTIRIIN